MIIADFREKRVIGYLDKKRVIIKPLQIADFVISENCALERKTVTDFVKSIIDKRMFRQAEEMVEYKRAILVIEGDGLFDLPGIHPNALMGAIASLILDYGLIIISTKDAGETARLISGIDKKEGKKKHEIPLRSKKKIKDIEYLRLYLMEGFPNIGPTLSKRILDKFKTPKEFFKADEKEMKKIHGLGKKKIKSILDVIGIEKNEVKVLRKTKKKKKKV